MQHFDEAITAFENGLKQYDTTCEAYFGLAKTYLGVGDTLNARNNLNKAQETLPYKHTDIYKEYLNEIYQEDLDRLKKRLWLRTFIRFYFARLCRDYEQIFNFHGENSRNR